MLGTSREKGLGTRLRKQVEEKGWEQVEKQVEEKG